MLFALLSTVVPFAQALDLRFWGVGPSLGTMVIPTAHPLGVPSNAETADGDDRIDPVRSDMLLGVRGVAYLNKKGRFNARITHGSSGTGWSRNEFLVGYDRVRFREDSLQLLVGASAGVGSETFPERGDGTGRLAVSYFPVRAGASALLRMGTWAGEAGLHATFQLPSTQDWYAAPGSRDPVASTFSLTGGMYAALVAEGTVYFGDFVPPEKKKPRARKDKKAKKKRGKGDGGAG
ncbi:MAG: hypothetical protein RLZZ299_2250 [Pseudomonadota bacterium]|jgi:hypothetical protein